MFAWTGFGNVMPIKSRHFFLVRSACSHVRRPDIWRSERFPSLLEFHRHHPRFLQSDAKFKKVGFFRLIGNFIKAVVQPSFLLCPAALLQFLRNSVPVYDNIQIYTAKFQYIHDLE
jgi:hypothetical protein